MKEKLTAGKGKMKSSRLSYSFVF